MDQWVEEILVDPLSKTTLKREGDCLVSDYGRKYPIRSGVCDLRLLQKSIGASLKQWGEGQREYENWSEELGRADSRQDHEKEKHGVSEVYQEIPVIGRCIDIGGHQGRLRAYLSMNQEYVCIDPYLDVFKELDTQPNLKNVYQFLNEPFNFICAFAEHLPFESQSFDTAHMRSCLDHLYNPELALLEAHRVLRDRGRLIVGLYVMGGKNGSIQTTSFIKNQLKRVLSTFINRFKDHHVWHPTYYELSTLIESCGFAIDRTHWQKDQDDKVCYIQARKVHQQSKC